MVETVSIAWEDMMLVRALLSLSLSFLMMHGTVYAQRNNSNSRDEKRENQRVREAEKEVGEARKKLSDAQRLVKDRLKVLEQSNAKIIEARRKYRDAEELAEEQFGKALGIPEAMAEVKALRKELDRLSEPVLARLHESKEWVVLSSTLEQRRKERDELLENSELDEPARTSKLAELSELFSKPVEMEEEAIQGVPECKSLADKLKSSVTDLDLLRKKISRDQVESHPKVKEAVKKIEQLTAENQRLEKEFASARSTANKAWRTLQAATQKMQKAKYEDAKDPNRPNKK